MNGASGSVCLLLTKAQEIEFSMCSKGKHGNNAFLDDPSGLNQHILLFCNVDL